MSSSLAAYMIDLAELRSAIGSRDAELIKAIRRENDADWLDGKDDVVVVVDVDDEEDGEGNVPIGKALEQLINGERSGEHGVALELLAAHLGTRLKGNWWGSIKLVALDETGVDAYVTNGPPVPLPEDWCAGGPMMGHLTRDAIRDLLANPVGLFSKADDEDLKNEFEGWLRTAVSRDTDLVFFCG